jgi:glycerol-3-phosphate dehydrogenase
MRLENRLEKHNFEENFDLIIIGGGINGAGVARDASERGLKVLLLEKNDFGSGCSAHSTRLIHGGLRYLEHLEFNLVQESLHEREILLRNYPHLVSPLRLMVPVYAGNKIKLWKLRLGMLLYDWLSAGKSLPSHQILKENQHQLIQAGIESINFLGAAFYYDAQVGFAERLVLENILTAQGKGAICLNHCEVSEIICSKIHGSYHAQGVKFKDLLNSKRPYTAYGKNIINMAGPWVDKLNHRLKETNSFPILAKLERRIGGTKGSHIVVKKFRGAPYEFGIYNEAKIDGRPFFILPYKIGMNDELYLIGTTDIFLEPAEDLDNINISQKEINYLLNETNELFPDAHLKEDDIVSTFCGVRPLPPTKPGKKAGSITRRHFVINHQKELVENYYSVVGGKLTTFRSLAKEVVDLFTPNRCFTDSRNTVGSQYPSYLNFYDYIKEITKEYSRTYDIDAHTILHLLMLYGTNTSKVLDLTLSNPLLKAKINKDYEDIEAQIIYAIRYEHAYTVEDILLRRLSIGLSTNKFDRDIIKTISYHIKEEFDLQGRNRDKYQEEVLINDFNNR